MPQGSHLGPILFDIFINDLRQVILFSQPLLFADDLKLFQKIDSLDDAMRLQGDLDMVSEWCVKNKMNLNIKKCKIMSFYRTKHPSVFDYSLNDHVLERVTTVVDLGVHLDVRLDFHGHYEYIVNKAFKLLGFVCLNAKDFHSESSLNNIYKTLVRAGLEYLSCVWSPLYSVHIQNIEKVQRRYSRYISFKFRLPAQSYDGLKRRLCLDSLSGRRAKSDIYFLFKLVNGIIDCPDLLNMINFRVPSRSTRDHSLFAVDRHRCNYGMSSPIARMINNSNMIDIDFFNTTFVSFKRRLSQLSL